MLARVVEILPMERVTMRAVRVRRAANFRSDCRLCPSSRFRRLAWRFDPATPGGCSANSIAAVAGTWELPYFARGWRFWRGYGRRYGLASVPSLFSFVCSCALPLWFIGSPRNPLRSDDPHLAELSA